MKRGGIAIPKPKWWMTLVVLLLQLLLNPCWHSEVKSSTDLLFVGINCIVVLFLLAYLSQLRPSRWAAGWLLGIPLIILYWIPNTPLIMNAIYLLTFFLYLYVAAIAIPALLRLQKVDIEQVAASLSIYLLIGMAWAIAYYFVNKIHPNSFAIDHGELLPSSGELSSFIYFSFVTLTTLGYGDIVPTSCIARSFAILEAVCGITCLSFVVARLIGLHTASVKK